MAKILVVDDNSDNRTILSRMLQLGGHEVTTAVDGLEALTSAEEQPPDLVLMDLAMPEMDGWTATRLLKETPELAHVPVIAVTGHVTTDEIRHAEQSGCQGVLSKPFELSRLMQLVAEHLGG